MCKSYYVGRVWRYQRGNQNPYIEEQTTQWICRLIDQGIWYWQFTCQPYKYILDNHMSVLCSFWISTKDEELDLPSLYWIPWSTVTLLDSLIYRHSTGFLHYTIVLTKSVILLGLQNAPRSKPLSKFLSSILSAVKTGLQSYCNTSCSMSVVNLMWILQIC